MAFRIEEFGPAGDWITYTDMGGLDSAKRLAFDLASGIGGSISYRVINTSNNKVVAHFVHMPAQTIDITHVDLNNFLSQYLRLQWGCTGLDLLRFIATILQDDGQDDEAENVREWLGYKRKERSYSRN